MNERLNAYIYKPVSSLIEKIGYPDRTQMIAGKTVYFWEKTQNSGYVSNNSWGGYNVFRGATVSVTNYTCRIAVEVDKNEIIQQFRNDKFNSEVCLEYANRLAK